METCRAPALLSLHTQLISSLAETELPCMEADKDNEVKKNGSAMHLLENIT